MSENDVRRLPRRDGASTPSQTSEPAPDSPEYLAQTALAQILRTPERQLLAIIQETAPTRDVGVQSRVLQLARGIIEGTIEVLHKAASGEPTPVLVDRLSFSWAVLRQSDVLVRNLKKAEMPAHTDVAFARKAFEGLLGSPLAQPFLAQVLDSLRLESDARYLHHYWFFRKTSSTPTRLPAPLGDAGRKKDLDAIRRIIWWSLRVRREQYVKVATGEPVVRIEFEWVLEKILDELAAWCGADLGTIPGLAGEVESELNRWLNYSQIESGSSDEAALEVGRAFIKFNDLKTKLVVDRSSGTVSADSRVIALQAAIKDHEVTITQYADENRRLEEQLALLKAKPAIDVPSTLAPSDPAHLDLRELLKLIDSKYSFDVLNSVQLGEDSHLTLRSFVAHLFYSLRKRGFSEYPTVEEFDLSYDMSGLYDCDGFEVPPGEHRRVRVLKRGWALVSKERTVPIRRARVGLANSVSVQS